MGSSRFLCAVSFSGQQRCADAYSGLYAAGKRPGFLKKFLQSSFATIAASVAKHLILDLRNNEAGLDRWGSFARFLVDG